MISFRFDLDQSEYYRRLNDLAAAVPFRCKACLHEPIRGVEPIKIDCIQPAFDIGSSCVDIGVTSTNASEAVGSERVASVFFKLNKTAQLPLYVCLVTPAGRSDLDRGF